MAESGTGPGTQPPQYDPQYDPQYGQQYGPPGQQYGQSYAPPPYGYPALSRPTNTMAVIALVLAFVFAPVGMVLGFVARRQIRQTGEDGDGLALAAMIVGAALTLLWLLFITAFVVLFAIAADTAVEVSENLPSYLPTPTPD